MHGVVKPVSITFCENLMLIESRDRPNSVGSASICFIGCPVHVRAEYKLQRSCSHFCLSLALLVLGMRVGAVM